MRKKKTKFTAETVIGEPDAKTGIDGESAASDNKIDLGDAAETQAAEPIAGHSPSAGGSYRLEDGKYYRV